MIDSRRQHPQGIVTDHAAGGAAGVVLRACFGGLAGGSEWVSTWQFSKALRPWSGNSPAIAFSGNRQRANAR
ncbi:hypothetical protein BQ8794_40178 [Mesorhizobium prunaredense]|uniref:Uncharacterized protein n=1 Tax=Mesorhizobium prunaredense TaxID=1631249 RepID=A0A1R3VCB6_9HYPH|nr:hypothetical protein BQ8794_40178 [Mesorhizobium prunaredense]